MQEPLIPDADSSPDIDLLVREDKLNLLFRQSFAGLFIAFAMAVLLGWLLWGHTDDAAIVGWLGALAVSSVVRLALFVDYFRTQPRGADLLALERPYVVSLVFSAAIWGVGALVVMPADSLLYQAITLCFLVGMAGGAVSVYSARYSMVVIATAATLLPGTIWLFMQGGKEQLGLAIGASIFLAVMLRTAKVLANALQSNFSLTWELHAAHAAADQQAKTDVLTSISNRRAFLDQGERLVHYCERHELAVSALVMDIDHFKSINDSLGHFAGDAVLRQVGEIVRALFRRSDVFGRIGGEEFAVILPHTTESDAHDIAEKLRRAIAETPIHCGEQTLNITASIGVASSSYDLTTLLVHADKAMYRAKERGRDRVVCHEESFVVSAE